jgi:poly(A) polymerase
MTIDVNKIDPDALKVVQRLRRCDHLAYLVGGCVRDLLLGRAPKDFDVATDATPPDLRRLFRNCRIIGRRFRLAHIFFGPKIIETSTFRDNPREIEEGQERESGAESDDILIRRDNVFGTAEQDARRRDFTINGLFFDTDKNEVIDYVNGMPDIEARLVRTIGDPDIRFREDPIRILRAVKFAARCELQIEPETQRRMIEHAYEIEKCAPARVTEEFFRLLRMGAAKRSMELLSEMGLLQVMVPEFASWVTQTSEDHPARERLPRYLDALDVVFRETGTTPSNAVVVAALALPRFAVAIAEEGDNIRDIGELINQLVSPILVPLRGSRRDSDNARQLLLLARTVLLAEKRPRRMRVNHRDLRADLDFLTKVIARVESISDAALAAIAPEAPTAAPAPARRGPMPISLWQPGAMSPIPVLPRALTSSRRRPAFEGTGSFGSVLSGPFCAAID